MGDRKHEGKLVKILVTGGRGFLGSHVADALSAAGHAVTLFDRQDSPWRRSDQHMIIGDVLDNRAVDDAVERQDVIYHLAALANIDTALHAPRETVEVNVLGTLNMLEAARRHETERFVFASSIYVYSNKGSFYRTSKQACENLLYDYQDRFGLDYTILRFGSLYGPRADRANFIYRALTQAMLEGRVDYPGTGEEIREYIHVCDAAAAAVDILDENYRNDIIHLTGRERMKTREVLEMIREIMGGNVNLSFKSGDYMGHYMQTPYSYTPKLGRKLVRNAYIDLGLGLLDCLAELDRSQRTHDISLPETSASRPAPVKVRGTPS